MGLLLLKRFLPRSNFFFNTIFLFRFLFSQRLGLPLFLFLDEKKKFAKRKIKAASERAKTPAFRLNGNKLAALKQISVLIACRCQFLYARSDEVGPFLLPLRNALRCSSFLLSLYFLSSSLYICYIIMYTLYTPYTIYTRYSLYTIYNVWGWGGELICNFVCVIVL